MKQSVGRIATCGMRRRLVEKEAFPLPVQSGEMALPRKHDRVHNTASLASCMVLVRLR